MIAWPAWPVPLACGLVPAVAVLLAWALSIDAGLIPDCLPWFEGCTSISRAARHGHGNPLFKLLMLPCALLQVCHWALAREWLRLRLPDSKAPNVLLAVGILAGAALAAYVTYLGTEGAFYGRIRRFGFSIYFGATFIAFLLFVRLLLSLKVHAAIARSMLAICALMLALGVTGVLVQGFLADAGLVDRIENALEWHLGIFLCAGFLLHSALWRASSFKVRLYA
ncbi:hypothetical protein [Usitatibacter palustris]|uniref:DUF998 domain-containing protein n=1 Tax=Usitatibacter palustris TaxID=2732487 RepID=A0A6M4H5F5_9PROT|nr:hypothetical protein [Usitatibacter palustris]QJR14395.1 hypothetical protein DSM104440_01191 [Usitatibacter palustris]